MLIKFESDPTLQHPRCVFQMLKRHFSRYTPQMVERYCGVPQEVFLKVADIFASRQGPEKTGAICYAVGWTQHSKGVQIIRAAAILQLLLGNIGRPGGGILGPARPRFHSGLHGHSHTVRHPPWLHAHAVLQGGRPQIEQISGEAQLVGCGSVVELRKVFCQPDEVVVRRCRD